MLPNPTEAPAVHKYTERFDDQAAAGRPAEDAIQEKTPGAFYRKSGPRPFFGRAALAPAPQAAH
jgi:hypothetical protein